PPGAQRAARQASLGVRRGRNHPYREFVQVFARAVRRARRAGRLPWRQGLERPARPVVGGGGAKEAGAAAAGAGAPVCGMDACPGAEQFHRSSSDMTGLITHSPRGPLLSGGLAAAGFGAAGTAATDAARGFGAAAGFATGAGFGTDGAVTAGAAVGAATATGGAGGAGGGSVGKARSTIGSGFGACCSRATGVPASCSTKAT